MRIETLDLVEITEKRPKQPNKQPASTRDHNISLTKAIMSGYSYSCNKTKQEKGRQINPITNVTE